MENQSRRDIKSEALLSLKTEIANDLIVNYVIDHMIETDVFTEEEKTAILRSGDAIGSADDLRVREEVLRIQTFTLIDLLREKMKQKDFAYNSFVFIIMKEGYYPWVGHKLLHLVMQLKNETQLLNQLSQPLILEEMEFQSSDECCVKDCKNRAEIHTNVIFHSFPVQQPERCRNWVIFCNNPELNELLERDYSKLWDKLICSDHFEDEDKILPSSNAVPTLMTPERRPSVLNTQIQSRLELTLSPPQIVVTPTFSPNSSSMTSSTQSESSQESRVENIQIENQTKESALNYVIQSIKSLDEEVLNPVMSEIIEYHLISSILNEPRLPKWTNKVMQFCADLYHKSPIAYSIIQRTMTLPTIETIEEFIEHRTQMSDNTYDET